MIHPEESFAKIEIDRQSQSHTDDHIPPVNYWTLAYGHKLMTTQQSHFYNLFKDRLQSGRKFDLPEYAYGYVSLYKDELLREYSKKDCDRDRILQLAKSLVELYDYKGSDLDLILKPDADDNRERQEHGNMNFFKFKRDKKAHILSELMPVDGQHFRLIRISELIDILGVESGEGDIVDRIVMSRIQFALYPLGLKINVNMGSFARLRYDDTIAVYSSVYDDIPTRGAIPTMMGLIAWMLQADGIKPSDQAIVDNWIEGHLSNYIVAAKATMLSLYNRKIILTRKRKIKATRLQKFVKRREELISVLLTIMSETEAASPKRMKRLETIYELIGLNPADIHSDLHRMATSPTTLTSVKTSNKAKQALDMSKVKEMAHSTIKAQEILSEVFSDTGVNDMDVDQSSGTAPQVLSTLLQAPVNPTLSLLRTLITKAEWSRDEFAAMSKEYGETAGSMLERLNDWAYDTEDEPVADDDGDIITIDLDVAHNLLEKN